ncbi:proliferation marker protein Ki-67 [Misgurnus anguillicaudatus]|uniref:proliferation marker protein Ki-67 n=1 Tax=Misgurnus anguillicaudatus TaxID=75329 RepID=UPI003CCF0938
MPLLGKIVVIKRNGEDGTEFPLTASCLFGRKLNCDIRIQLPQVSKEHCRIELNENKELILTNLSSVNPTLINGEALEQSELLKNGDLITIIDRSFRFEYPPPKTPKKKRLSTTGKDKTPQQEKSTPVPVEKRKSEHSIDTCLKDGTNLPQPVEQTEETADDEKPKKNSMSPFGELCQMVKQDLAAKSPWKSGIAKTPLARPQVNREELEVLTDAKSGPEQVMTPPAKRRRSSKGSFEDTAGDAVPQSLLEEKTVEDIPSVESSTASPLEKSGTPVSQKKRTPSKTPEKFSAGEVVQQILLEPQPEEKTPKSPKRRRSSSALHMSSSQPQTPVSEENTDVKASPRTSPRSNAGKRFQVQDVLSEMKSVTFASEDKDKDTTSVTEESHTSVTVLKSKRKRVSFGGQLSPELFDKRLPPDSPLRRGATPRRSLGPSQKPQSLLRRASTIGLMALRLKEMVPESPKSQRSPAKKASPKQAAAAKKSPSPAKRSPGTKAKTPSPKPKKSPSGTAKASSPSSTPATPKTPASSRRASTSAISNGSVLETPTVQGRFSVSRISTPSPVQDQVDECKGDAVEDAPQVSGTPKIPLRRKSMKSARKTPKSAMKSALEVIRSRRSGASRANLKVLNSWADIVKFGQTKPPTEVTTTRKTTKSTVAKKTTVVSKPKTPARRLKDVVSTGHAASPVTIVVGKAHLRTNQSVGAAPKIVPNLALFKKDMKMDEDLTGVADIFKTPAKPMVPINNACPETPVDEFSVMKTPEESGEMIVSPLSVKSTAKLDRYDNEAVTRLLLDNQDGSLLGEDSLSQTADSSHDTQELVEMLPSDETEEEEQGVPEQAIKTPKQAAPPSLCLTGVKRLMKTPKQKAEPIEDLRGKLLKTPKAPKRAQEENLEGVKEVLKTPKHRGVAVEDMVGVKRVMQTPKVKSNPVLCAAGLKRLMKTPREKSEQHEDLTGVKELMQTPKLMREPVEDELEMKRSVDEKSKLAEEDLIGSEQVMKHKGQPVEDEIGEKSLLQTPKEKVELVEDLTGVKELMKTPKQKGEPVKNKFGINKLMKTPRQKRTPTEEEFTGLKELVEEPEISSAVTTQNNVIEPTEVQEPVTAVDNGSALIAAKDFDMECDKENVCPVEPMETEVLKSVDAQSTAAEVDPQLKNEAVIPQKDNCDQIEEEPVSVQVTDVCSSEVVENNKEQSEETVCISENSSVATETAPSSSAAEQEEEVIKSSVASKTQRGSRGRAAQKSKAPAVLSLIDESGPPPSSPGRGRRVKKLIEVPEIVASPVRKSARGKVPKRCFEEEEAKNTQAVQAPVDSMKNEISDSLPAVTKTRRGRKAQKDDAEIEPAVDAQCSDAKASEEEQAPVPKAGRRKINKMESQPSEEQQQTTEIVCEENAVAPDDVTLQTSVVPEAPTAATRTRKGRTTKKESLKEPEPTPTLESDMTSTDVVVAEKPQASVAKSGRGRSSKKETVKDKALDEDPKVEVKVDSQEDPEAPVVKSGRGRKAKQQKPQMAEEDDKQASVESSTDVVVTEEPVTEVKSVRRGRQAKQSKESVSIEAEENVVSAIKQAEVPVVKSVRKRGAAAKEVEIVAEVPVKRGRRAVVDPTPSVAVVSGRGRKAVNKPEPEVTEETASSEEQVKSVKQTRRTAKDSTKNENPTQASSECVAVVNTAPEKVGRGSRGKKEKGSTKDTPKSLTNESAAAVEDCEVKPSKTVNWSPDLVVSKDIEKVEPSTDVKEAQLKKSKVSSAKVSTETDQSVDPPPRGRRGRGAKKEEEPSVEDCPEEVQIKAKPLRRGKAVASTVPKSEPIDNKASTPLKRKRNEVLDETEDQVDKEPLPKRRGRMANTTEVPSKEKTPEVEPTPKKTSKRTARGQSKAAQEPDPEPAPESISGPSTRKGRSVKKTEEVDSTVAAPVRRTRRK